MPTPTTTEEIIKDLIVRQLGVNPEQVTPKTNLVKDLSVDSLDQVELLMALEEKFETSITEAEGEKIVTVQDAIDLINHRADREAQDHQG